MKDVPVRKEEVRHAMREIGVILTVLLIPVVLSTSPMTLVQATTMGGTWLSYRASSTEFPNGTTLNKGTIVFVGILVGNGTFTEREFDESFEGIMVFVGSFNGSESGSLTLVYHGSGPSWEGTMSGGTGGLAGLQLSFTGTSEECTSSAVRCNNMGSYTVTVGPTTALTTATTSSSTPIITAMGVIVIIAAIGAIVLRSRGKKTKT